MCCYCCYYFLLYLLGTYVRMPRSSLSTNPGLCVLHASLKTKLIEIVGHCLTSNRHHSCVNVTTLNLLCFITVQKQRVLRAITYLYPTLSSPLFVRTRGLIMDYIDLCFYFNYRQFGTKCARCGRSIHANDWVRRARSSVYHLACFACDACKRQLSTGEEFALKEGHVLCKLHYMESLEVFPSDNSSQEGKFVLCFVHNACLL